MGRGRETVRHNPVPTLHDRSHNVKFFVLVPSEIPLQIQLWNFRLPSLLHSMDPVLIRFVSFVIHDRVVTLDSFLIRTIQFSLFQLHKLRLTCSLFHCLYSCPSMTSIPSSLSRFGKSSNTLEIESKTHSTSCDSSKRITLLY